MEESKSNTLGVLKIVNTIQEMQNLSTEFSRGGQLVALVPTMGALHEGHISLTKHARKAVGPYGIVVVSIYVNPTQFGPSEDFTKYPRTFESDLEKCQEAGVDVIFNPSDSEMYPGRDKNHYSVFVTEFQISQSMEGASRPGHFDGVTTIVAKLFNACLPQFSVFGQKDFQQCAVIKKMVLDLNYPIKIIEAPTIREADGLALSSRNKYLNTMQRMEAPVLYNILKFIHRRVLTEPKENDGVEFSQLLEAVNKQIDELSEISLDYLLAFDPITFAVSDRVRIGDQVAIAAFAGKTRLLDNIAITD